MIYGTPIIHVETDETDKIGIRTLVLSQLWQSTKANPTQAELDAETPAPPEVPGGVYLIGQQTRRSGGAMNSTWTFEGINGNGKSVTFKDRSNSLDYEFQPGFSERSILQLPNIQSLIEQYGGTLIDGTVTFPSTLPGTKSGAGLSGSKSSEGQPNPMFGRETYFNVDGTYSFRYASVSRPSQNGVARITMDLPGDPPSYSGRNWLKLPVHYQRRGPIYECLEQYWHSEDGGWPAELYGNPNSKSSGGGL